MEYKLLMQYVKKSSCEVPMGSVVFSGEKKQPEVKVKVDINVTKLSKEDNFYEVNMIFNISSEITDGILYKVDFIYCTIIQFDGDEDTEEMKRISMVDVPYFMFPFARAIISNLVREAGFMGLMIDPIDFNTLYEKQGVSTEIANDSEDK